jgi:hypothetical protein
VLPSPPIAQLVPARMGTPSDAIARRPLFRHGDCDGDITPKMLGRSKVVSQQRGDTLWPPWRL